MHLLLPKPARTLHNLGTRTHEPVLHLFFLFSSSAL